MNQQTFRVTISTKSIWTGRTMTFSGVFAARSETDARVDAKMAACERGGFTGADITTATVISEKVGA